MMLIVISCPSPISLGLVPTSVIVSRAGTAVYVLAKAGKIATTAESVSKAMKATANDLVLFLKESNLETPLKFIDSICLYLLHSNLFCKPRAQCRMYLTLADSKCCTVTKGGQVCFIR